MKLLSAWSPAPPASLPDRWPQRAILTSIIQVLSFLAYPAFICGCHFHSDAVPIGLIPVGVGFYFFFFCRTRGERIVGYFNGALALAWIALAWLSNFQFFFL